MIYLICHLDYVDRDLSDLSDVRNICNSRANFNGSKNAKLSTAHNETKTKTMISEAAAIQRQRPSTGTTTVVTLAESKDVHVAVARKPCLWQKLNQKRFVLQGSASIEKTVLCRPRFSAHLKVNEKIRQQL